MPRKQADPIAMLKADHDKVKKLFDQFESSSKRSKERIARNAILELDVHAELEETIFYPAMKEAAEGREDLLKMLEAEEEHHVVHLLIGELRGMPGDDDRFEAKFMVLAENVRHHIEEEESEMLPKAGELDSELLNEIGQRMADRKKTATAEFKAQMESSTPASASSARSGRAAAGAGTGSRGASSSRATASSRAGSSSGTARSRSGGSRGSRSSS